MTTAVLSFATFREVRLECNELALYEVRPLEEVPPFPDWVDEYLRTQHHPDEEARLLNLGCAIGDWLDGPQRWLTRLLDSASPPLVFQIEASRRPGPLEKAALQVPWELIAHTVSVGSRVQREHLALDPQVKLSPVRRLDVPGRPAPTSACRFSVLFMAAQPHDVCTLDFEREEAAIAAEIARLDADRLDLFVEESGTLDGLAAAALRAAQCDVVDRGPTAGGRPLAGPVDVVHISCHGIGGDEPMLALEDDVGAIAPTSARQLAEALTAHVPALGFISAGSTSEATSSSRSLAAELCLFGWPAALSWSSPVDDGDATWLAAQLYHRLAQRMPLADALAECRYAAIDRHGPRRRVWHQARLYTGRTGGNPMGIGTAKRQPAKAGVRQYVDRAEGRVPVARDDEFVGRRRSLQRVLAKLRDPALVGAVIHGPGRLGKSSLAARVSHRRADLHTVVIYKDYDAQAILTAVVEHARAVPMGQGQASVEEIIARHRPQRGASWGAAGFGGALRELLEGPCQHASAGAVLLVIDDFERVLTVPAPGTTHALVAADQLEPDTVAALIEAFKGATTDSRLLFTSRYRFSVPDASDRDLATCLWPEQLGAMPTQDLAKRVRPSAQGTATGPATTLPAHRTAALALCHGSPGLLQVLLTIIERTPDRWPAIEAELRAYAERGKPMTQVDLVAFMTQISLDALIDALGPRERQLLRLLTVFQTHVPSNVATTLGRLAQIDQDPIVDEAIERMVSLGLIDVTVRPSPPDTARQPGADKREISLIRWPHPPRSLRQGHSTTV